MRLVVQRGELPDEPPTGRLRDLGSVPPMVWAVTVLHGCLLVLYSIAVPLYQAPDEPAHLDLALKLRERTSYPAGEDGSYHDAAVIRSVELATNLPSGAASPPECPDCPDSLRRVMMPAEALGAEDAAPASQRPSFRELGFGQEASENLNAAWQHPPLYYVVESTALTAVVPFVGYGDDWPHDRVVAWLRLTNALMLLPLPMLVYLAAAQLGARRTAASAASALPLAIPQLTHIGSSINNDNLLILLVGVLTVLVARIASGDLRTRLAVGAGVVAGLAILTKAFGLFTVGWLPAAYAVAWARGRSARPALRGAVVSLAVSLVAGGWWWARNLLLTGRVQPLVKEQPEAPDDFVAGLGHWFDTLRSELTRTFWGHFGWLDHELALGDALTTGLTTLVGAGIALGLSALAARRDERVLGMALMLLPLVGIGILIAYGTWSIYTDTGRIRGTQGRYAFPSVTGLAVAVAMALSALKERWSRLAPLGVLALGCLAQALSLPRILLRFWAPDGGGSLRASAGAMVAWSPWPRTMIMALLAVIAAVSALLGAQAVRAAVAAGDAAAGTTRSGLSGSRRADRAEPLDAAQ